MSIRNEGHLVIVESNLTGTGREALRYAHSSGWRPIFVTADLARYSADPATAAAIGQCAEVLECATLDAGEVEYRLKEHGGSLAGIMTVGEYFVPAAAELAHRLGLPGLNPASALVARNKLECRRVTAEAGIASPAFGFAADERETDEVLSRVGLPCVVKPTDESGSVGVTLCRSRHEVLERVAELAHTFVNRCGQHHVPGALIEQFLEGPEVSVETMTYRGRHHVQGVTSKLLGSLPSFVELGHTFPAHWPGDMTGAAADLAIAALRAIGFDFGAAHTEIKLTSDGPFLIEVNPRIAGDNIPRLIWHAVGVPFLEEYVRMHMGADPNLLPSKSAAAAIRFITGEEGQLAAISGAAEARQAEGVTDLVLRVAPGDITHSPRHSHHRLGYVITTGSTPAEAQERAERTAGKIRLSYLPDSKGISS